VSVRSVATNDTASDTGRDLLPPSLPLADAEKLYWGEVARLRVAEQPGDESAPATIEQLNQAMMARRVGSPSVTPEKTGDPDRRAAGGAGRGLGRRVSYSLLLAAVAVSATAWGLPQVGVALTVAAAGILLIKRKSGLGASPQDPSIEDTPESATRYATAADEVAPGEQLEPEALVEFDALRGGVAEPVQEEAVPASTEPDRGAAARNAALEDPPERTMASTSESMWRAASERELDTIELVERSGDAPPSTLAATPPGDRGSAERLYSQKGAAEYLRVHVTTLRKWVRSGRLPASRLAGGRQLRIRESDLLGILEPLEHATRAWPRDRSRRP
jgi:excisionase family DNA binding protein